MRIFKCSACSKIHVEAGNVLMHFPTLKRLMGFLDYLESIDPHYYKAANSSKGLARDVYLPVGDASVSMAFSVGEFEELKQTIRRFLDKENVNPFLRISLSGFLPHTHPANAARSNGILH
ncbi:MAG: hypothetical protein LBL94_11675 [Prevotellaceae bacterium]|jgi:hypothetical protein|nr:hypothetical protein [Prevotellaceae bacterium]